MSPRSNGVEASRDQLQLETVLVQIEERCSNPVQLVEEEAVLDRLNGLRNRLSRLLGHHHKVAARQHLAEMLIGLAAGNTAMTQRQCQELEQSRQRFVQRLANNYAAELASTLPIQDPERNAALLWRRTIERKQQWLQEQRAPKWLHTWKIEGFGEGRMTLLKCHGLERGFQLLAMADQLNALPGIGRVLHQRHGSTCTPKSRSCERNSSIHTNRCRRTIWRNLWFKIRPGLVFTTIRNRSIGCRER